MIGLNCVKNFTYLYALKDKFSIEMEHFLSKAFDVVVEFRLKLNSDRNIEGELVTSGVKKYLITIKGKGEINIASDEICLISSAIKERYVLKTSSVTSVVKNRNVFENYYFQGSPMLSEFKDNLVSAKDGDFYLPILECLIVGKNFSNKNEWKLELEEK